MERWETKLISWVINRYWFNFIDIVQILWCYSTDAASLWWLCGCITVAYLVINHGDEMIYFTVATFWWSVGEMKVKGIRLFTWPSMNFFFLLDVLICFSFENCTCRERHNREEDGRGFCQMTTSLLVSDPTEISSRSTNEVCKKVVSEASWSIKSWLYSLCPPLGSNHHLLIRTRFESGPWWE